MNENDFTTPVKLLVNGDDVAIKTPSGGLIFNPFHKEFINRVGQFTFSPGIFACGQSPTAADDSRKSTPNRLSAPFVLSPDTQGSLFPAEIDENPVLQLRLQERLDTQCDDDVQDTIHSFFKSHLIAPSPVALDDHCTLGRARNLLPRTSSLIPHATPKVRRKPSCYVDPNAIVLTEAAIQTALSIPFDFDLETALKSILSDSSVEPTNSSCTFSMLDATSEPSGNQVVSNTAVNLPLFTACSVRRPMEGDSAGSFILCGSCRKAHPASYYGRRSLFSESSSMRDETINRQDGELLSQRTLVPHESQHTMQPANFVYLSSSMVEGNDSHDGQGIEDSEVIVSLLNDHGPGDRTPSTDWGGQSDASSPSGDHRSGATINNGLRPRRRSEEQPSTPMMAYNLQRCQQSTDDEPFDSDERVPKQTSHKIRPGRRRLSLPSPCTYRENMRLESPNLSPILPASRASPIPRYPSDASILNEASVSNTSVELRIFAPSFMDET